MNSLDASEGSERAAVAVRLYDEASVLAADGELDAALDAVDAVLDRFADVRPAWRLSVVADALALKAECLRTLDRDDEAPAVFDLFVGKHGSNAGLQYVHGAYLGFHGEPDRALDVFERLVEEFADATSDFDRLAVARALFMRAEVFRNMGRHGEAVEELSLLIRRFDADPPPQEPLIALEARFARSETLGDLGDLDGAIAGLDQFLDLVGQQVSGDTFLRVAEAMRLKGVYLMCGGRSAAALSQLERMLDRFAPVADHELDRTICDALVSMLGLLAEMDRPDGVGATANSVALRMAHIQAADVLAGLSARLIAAGTSLATRQRHAEALRTFELVLDRLRDAADPELLRLHAKAQFNTVSCFNHLGRQADAEAAAEAFLNSGAAALPVLDDLVESAGGRAKGQARQEVAWALSSRMAILDDLERPEEALASADEFLERFGHGREPIKGLLTAVQSRRAALLARDDYV